MRDRSSDRLTHRIQNLEHGVAAPVTAIEHMADAGRGEHFVRGQDMRPGQVADVDIVLNSRSVRGGEIVAVNRHFRPLAKRDLYGDLDK